MVTITDIRKEVEALLKALGYDPFHKVFEEPGGKKCIIKFHVHKGFESFPQRYKDAVQMLVKGYLSEFYYENDTQYIHLYSECKGLEPDDDRYSCLLHEIIRVDSNSILGRDDSEVFVNGGDHFKRLVNGNDLSSAE